jgi:hypothetical protein
MISWKTCALAVGLAALGGCAGPFLPGSPEFVEGQEAAVHMVWYDIFGRTDTPPEVRWVWDEQLNCTDPQSGRPGFKTLVGCVEGLTISPRSVSVCWRDGDTFSTTTMAHEFVHAAQARRLVFDANHKSPEFQPGGLVEQANVRLSEAGM